MNLSIIMNQSLFHIHTTFTLPGPARDGPGKYFKAPVHSFSG